MDEQRKQYREANREKIVESDRRYVAENREKVRETKRLSNLKHVEKRKRYVVENREEIAERHRTYRSKHRKEYVELARKWRLSNPERYRQLMRLAGHRRRAKQNSAQVIDFTAEQLEQRMAYYGHSCYLKLPGICTGAFDQVDHVKPIDKLGPHMLANLRPACAPCNRRKWAHWPFDRVSA